MYLKNTGGTVVSNWISMTADEWTELGYTWNGTHWWTIKNGNLTYLGAFSGTLDCRGNNFIIGAQANMGMFFNGTIDEVRVYNRAIY